ncbi:Transport protein particle (TRAPP) component [Zea mays]|uniref:Transport protein particle (TRAPP) component n=1 Tax=Zea mays TaxID=4577 RepID=A0A1D6DUL8_MAIZE|nr:Transport protein particle (TRAPP) component [Zea mays]
MPPAPKSGDALFASVDRVNAELFTLTYGAIVRQLLTDLEEVEEVNKQLDQMYPPWIQGLTALVCFFVKTAWLQNVLGRDCNRDQLGC